jgi:hypothetical protein
MTFLPPFLLHPTTLWAVVGIVTLFLWVILGRRILLAYLMSAKEARPSVEFLMFLLCGPVGWYMLARFLRFHFAKAEGSKGKPTTKP